MPLLRWRTNLVRWRERNEGGNLFGVPGMGSRRFLCTRDRAEIFRAGCERRSLCIIKTTEAKVQPYNEVDARSAFEKGEGDRSLEYWREAHRHLFSRALANIDKKPTPDMPLVYERFRVIYE